MSTAQVQLRSTAIGAARTEWLRAGAALFGAAWGSNQFTPMLLVYHGQLGLSTGTLEALFGVYALGLIPGLLIAGPVSDARGRRHGRWRRRRAGERVRAATRCPHRRRPRCPRR